MTTTSQSRPATIDDVARLAGVSRAAVSKVIRNAYGVSPAMRARVGAAIDELDYRPSVAARALRGSSFTLGIETPDLGNPFFAKILRGATEALAGTPFQLIVAPAEVDAKSGRALEALVDRQVAGMVAVSPLVEPDWLERLGARIPIVMLGRHDHSEVYDTVAGDDVAGTRVLMDHLLGLGHTAIAHLTRSEAATGPSSPHGHRLQTYLATMQERGIPEFSRVVRTGATEHDAYLTTLQLLADPDRPTAIFAGHDQLALGALKARAELGLSPAEVSVVGYDDIEIAEHPLIGLTTMDQFGGEMGAAATRMLIERIEGRTASRQYLSHPVLRERASSTVAPTPRT